MPPKSRVVARRPGGMDKKVALLTRERDDSLQQQTATSEVLQVISSSPGDLQPVFETMLENAVRICDAKFGNIYRWEGNVLASLPRTIRRSLSRGTQTFTGSSQPK